MPPRKQAVPFAFLFWKKNLNVFFAPMIITTPERKRICHGQRRAVSSAATSPLGRTIAWLHASAMRERRGEAHVSHRKKPLVEEHDHAEQHKEEPSTRQANAYLCATAGGEQERESVHGWSPARGWAGDALL